MKFVMTQAVCPEGMQLLHGIAEVYVAGDRDPNHYLDQMETADAMVVRVGRMDEQIMERCPKLRVIGRTGVGYDTIDVAAATRRGIPVVITPGANSRAVAEHSLAFMLALAQNLVESHEELRAGHYGVRDKGVCFELQGKTALILGLGATGSKTAALCAALGMRVLGCNPSMSAEQIEAMGFEPCADYRAALQQADVVSLHVPLRENTRGMIGREELALMKKTALLINCARGGVVDEQALADALNEGRLGGAGIDCFAQDPPPADHPLLHAKNALVSPHSAALTRESVVSTATMCLQGCLAVLRGERWMHVANPEVYDSQAWKNRQSALTVAE